MMRRRRNARHAREQWIHGQSAPLARVTSSQAFMAAMYPLSGRIIDLLELEPGKRYLDVGCGTGAFAHLLAQRAGLTERPFTADIAQGPGPVDVQAWPEHLPFADGSVDCITSFHFIRRFDDDVVHGYAQELSRILAPGGSGLLVEYAPTHAEWLNRVHSWLTGRDCAQVDLRGWGRAAALMTECGFGAVNLVSLGPPLFPPIPRLAVLFRHHDEREGSAAELQVPAGMVEAGQPR